MWVVLSSSSVLQCVVNQVGSELDDSFLHNLGQFGVTVDKESKSNISIAKVITTRKLIVL